MHKSIGFVGFVSMSDPDVPIFDGVTNVEQTSVTLHWNTGDTQVINSSLLYYMDVSYPSSWQTSAVIHQLTGLSPGHEYRFYLRVRSFDKTAQSLNHTFTTGEFVR